MLPADYVAEYLELGYATTAHRAQGRTVDSAHAYVTATTVREPLYVMSTRGRDSNRLYVDTAYDPDVATAHGEDVHADPVEVLQSVITTSAADLLRHRNPTGRGSRSADALANRSPRRCGHGSGAEPRCAWDLNPGVLWAPIHGVAPNLGPTAQRTGWLEPYQFSSRRSNWSIWASSRRTV